MPSKEIYIESTRTIEQKLAHASEEAAELVVAISKAQRWGLESANPELPPEEQERNWQWILREITDVRTSCDRLEAELLRMF